MEQFYYFGLNVFGWFGVFIVLFYIAGCIDRKRNEKKEKAERHEARHQWHESEIGKLRAEVQNIKDMGCKHDKH